MEEKKTEFEPEIQYEATKDNRINFPFIVFRHILLISRLRGEITTAQNVDEKIFSLLESVNCLEDLIYPFFDQRYVEETDILDEEDTGWIVQDNILFMKKKDMAIDYARKKLQCIMSLLRRKNLLPEERANPEDMII